MTLVQIAARPGAQHFRCLLRVCFVPADPMALYTRDAAAFDYYYQQCVADVVGGRFAYEMRYEMCIRLCAYHMQQVRAASLSPLICMRDQVTLDAGQSRLFSPSGKVSLKQVEKEYGLSTFLPAILLENVKRKEIRKHVRFYLKRTHELLQQTGTATASTTTTTAEVVMSANGSAPHESSSACLSCRPACPAVRAVVRVGSNGSLPGRLSTLPTAVALRCRYMLTLAQLPSYGSRAICVTFMVSAPRLVAAPL